MMHELEFGLAPKSRTFMFSRSASMPHFVDALHLRGEAFWLCTRSLRNTILDNIAQGYLSSKTYSDTMKLERVHIRHDRHQYGLIQHQLIHYHHHQSNQIP